MAYGKKKLLSDCLSPKMKSMYPIAVMNSPTRIRIYMYQEKRFSQILVSFIIAQVIKILVQIEFCMWSDNICTKDCMQLSRSLSYICSSPYRYMWLTMHGHGLKHEYYVTSMSANISDQEYKYEYYSFFHEC